MGETELLANLGFHSNPFQYTDADQEDRLSEYFVPPPYFDAVFGEPSRPASAIVFAPRGSGKSAQRRMVEIKSQSEPLLCVTYDTFSFLLSKDPQEVTLEDHLRQVVRIALIGLLTTIEGRRDILARLDANQKKALQLLSHAYLDSLTQLELKHSLDALKSVPEKAKEVWNENFWMISSVATFILQKLGIPLSQPALGQGFGESLDPSPRLHVDLLGRLSTTCGLSAVYVLIDKVDETSSTTNNPEAAYSLIAPLIEDLAILAARPFCFKFFLPDNLELLHQQAGRPDRIQHHRLAWRWSELKTILERRLAAHSERKITRPEDLVSPIWTDEEEQSSVKTFLDEWVYRFAESSPRDLIRIWQKALAEQLRQDQDSNQISTLAILTGLDTFCEERANELLPEHLLTDLSRVGRIDFTTNYVANEVFRIKTNSARNKIKAWVDTGIVVRQPDRQETAGRRPQHHYAIEDSRVARTVLKNMAPESFWLRKMNVCDKCDSTILRDWDMTPVHVCRQCGTTVSYEPNPNL